MTRGRPWSEEDIAKLKSMAGRRPAKDIAVALGRTVEATVVAASKLKLSLRTRFDFGRAASVRLSIRCERAATAAPSDEACDSHQETSQSCTTIVVGDADAPPAAAVGAGSSVSRKAGMKAGS